MIGSSIGTTTSWPGFSTTAVATSPSERPSTFGALGVDEIPLQELAGDERDAAGRVHVGGDESAPGLEARDDRSPGGDAVEVLQLEGDVQLAGDGEQVEDTVRGATGRDDRCRGVLERLARDDRRGPDIVSDEAHRKPARLGRGFVLRGVERRNAVQAGGADPEEVERRRHGVRRELAPAGTRPWAGSTLELVDVGAGHLPDRVGSDRLEDVLDRHVPPAKAARRDRAVVEDEPGKVEPCERHHGGGDRLVAADQADEPVEKVPARHELDRVRDHLARDERGAHSLGPHRDAVRDRDRVELDGHPAGLADPALHVLGELPLVPVTRHRLDPRRRDTDERPGEVVVREADPLEHRPGGRAVGPVRERGAVALGRIGWAVVRVLAHTRPAPWAATPSGITSVSGKRARSSASHAFASSRRAQTTTEGPEPESETPSAPLGSRSRTAVRRGARATR